jgi:uncharacterized protein YcbX
VSLETVELDEKGFQGDRRFMIVAPVPTPPWGSFLPTDSTHRFLTQRQCPSFATVDATFDGDLLTLTCNGTSIQLATRAPLPCTTYRVGIWDDQVEVDDMGDAAAAFVQAIVNSDLECIIKGVGDECDSTTATAATTTTMYPNVRLVSHTLQDRLADPAFVPSFAKSWFMDSSPPISLTDGFPILIASQASLDELNRRLVQEGKDAISMSRFRPNIVIQGKSLQPFEEDQWKVIAIGDQLFSILKVCFLFFAHKMAQQNLSQKWGVCCSHGIFLTLISFIWALPLFFLFLFLWLKFVVGGTFSFSTPKKACPRCKQSCTDQVTGEITSEPVGIMGSFRALGKDGSTDVFFAQNALALNRRGTIQKGATVRVLERGDPVYC